jgi:alcohol dehydrogenase (cytochrome c)
MRPGDNLYTASLLALRPKTGEIVWHYQFTPNDAYDYDANSEPILADIDVEGAKRKVVMQLNRNGFLYVLDRTNGKLLSAKPYVSVNWADHVDLKTGRPVETEVARRLRAGEQIEQRPSTRGGKNWPHASFNPQTGLLYANTINEGRLFQHLAEKPFVPGERYMFVENKALPRVAEDPVGHIEAIEPLSAEKRWKAPLYDHTHWSAILTTGGGLLFTGKETGEFIAVDIDSGRNVWMFQTGSGINAQPVTYTHDGRQYVTILSGIGGLYWNTNRADLKNVPQGGSVWTFALLPE